MIERDTLGFSMLVQNRHFLWLLCEQQIINPPGLEDERCKVQNMVYIDCVSTYMYHEHMHVGLYIMKIHTWVGNRDRLRLMLPRAMLFRFNVGKS